MAARRLPASFPNKRGASPEWPGHKQETFRTPLLRNRQAVLLEARHREGGKHFRSLFSIQSHFQPAGTKGMAKETTAAKKFWWINSTPKPITAEKPFLQINVGGNREARMRKKKNNTKKNQSKPKKNPHTSPDKEKTIWNICYMYFLCKISTSTNLNANFSNGSKSTEKNSPAKHRFTFKENL